ncbi:MAG: glycosyltransferase family 39 protein [Candidatus Coatesbacteria bacterium]|nr:glycosyltransferase family 39 protein [Candidatus Coatesbacteria bacterium]
MDGSRRLHICVLVGFMLFSVLIYHKTTSFYFSGDTFDFLGPLSKSNLTKAFLKPEVSYTYRPVPRFCWLLFFTILGRDPFWYHVLNIVTHAFCGFLIYLLARELKDDTLWAVLAGAIFISMPVHYDAVSTIYHWVEPASTCLMIISMLLYMKATQGEKRHLPWLSGLVFFVALMTKQSAASLLLVIAAWDLIMARRNRHLWPLVKEQVKFYIPLILAIALAAALNLIAKPGDKDAGMVLSISLSYRMPLFLLSALTKAAKPWFLPGLAVLLCAPLLMGRRLARFSLLVALLLPFPFYALTSDRHAYLPAVGIALAVAAFLRFGNEKSVWEADAAGCCPPVRKACERPTGLPRMIVDIALLCAIFCFFLIPYKAPEPSLFEGNQTHGWHSQLDPTYWQSMGALLRKFVASPSLSFGAVPRRVTALMLMSLGNLLSIAVLALLKLLRWRGPLNSTAWAIVRGGLAVVLLVGFSASTYSASLRDGRPDAWREDAALIAMKAKYPDLPDNSTVYISDDSVFPLLDRIRFYYDLKEIKKRRYSEFFSDAARGDGPPYPDRTRCFAYEDGEFVRKESDELLLARKLREDWRPDYAHTDIDLGGYRTLPGPVFPVVEKGWVLRELKSDELRTEGFTAKELNGRIALCFEGLIFPTISVNELELLFGAELEDRAIHPVSVIWQLDGERWFRKRFEFPCDGAVRKLNFKLSDSRDWFMANKVTGFCLVFEQEPIEIQVDEVHLSFGLRMGLPLMRFPGAEEQFDLAIEDIFKIE